MEAKLAKLGSNPAFLVPSESHKERFILISMGRFISFIYLFFFNFICFEHVESLLVIL